MLISQVCNSNPNGAGEPAPPPKKEVNTIETATKRKTHTSTAVKNRYNAKAYRKFQAALKPDLSQRIENYTAKEGISKPEFLQRAIEALDH